MDGSSLPFYLVPEPILTRELMPFFEAALSADNSMNECSDGKPHNGERSRAQGLPNQPKGGIRKAPSLSTFAMPTLTPRAPSETLILALSELIARLPMENRDLLQTVIELIKITSKRHKETKMPLSNLLLIFTPSLAMSGALLRVLCEGEGIWDGVKKIVDGPLQSSEEEGEKSNSEDSIRLIDASKQDSSRHGVAPFEEERDEGENADVEGESGLRPQRTIRRAQKASHNLLEDASNQSSAPKDDTSETSFIPQTNDLTPTIDTYNTGDTLVPADTSGPVSPAIYNLRCPPPLTSSSESFATLPSSGSSSPMRAPEGLVGTERPLLRSLPSKGSIRKSFIGRSIPFPLTSSSTPISPIDTVAHSKLSTHSSSPNLNSSSTPPSIRRKRPSLQNLLPKRSLSSLFGMATQPPTPETPDEIETESQSHAVSTVCPVLELPVNTSPIKLGIDLIDVELAVGDGKADGLSPSDAASPVSRVSSSNSSAVTSGGTVFYTPLTSLPHHAPPIAAADSTGSFSLLDFSIGKDAPGSEAEDWTNSVLRAADAESVSRTTSTNTEGWTDIHHD